MKTENTLENKAKFFAQYWGQKIMIDPTIDKRTFPVTSANIEYEISDPYLELTPLSDITDEDAIEVARHLACYKSDIVNSVKDHLKENHPHGDSLEQPELDYLRSKGYALPWLDLSVEDLVAYEWIKLKP